MFRKSIAVAAAALACAFAADAASAATPTLVGTVGPSFTITLKMAGKKVQTLKAGTYKLVIDDKAPVHAFSLDGPHGFAKDFTTVPFVGSKTITLELVPGKYKAYCPPHESVMFQHFTVT
jgi:hypothetical protein